MYYKLKRNNIRKWLFSWHSKIYIPILIVLCFFIYFAFKLIDVSNQENKNNDVSSTAAVTEEVTESGTTFVATNNSYLIKINKSRNFITIFKMDANNEFTAAFKTFRCSVNANVPPGKLLIMEKSVWRMLAANQYGQYTSKIGATYYIHSVPYSSEKNSTLITEAYNNLGNPAQIGSIYLAVTDAKWIYENCGINTAVEVYENATEEPAIALPEKVTLPYGTGYDPSDLQASNKVVQTKIDYLQGVRDKQVAVGASINLWENIYAVDLNGNNITSYISISGTVNTSVPGQYTVTYTLMDAFGKVISYNSVITVTGTPATTN